MKDGDAASPQKEKNHTPPKKIKGDSPLNGAKNSAFSEYVVSFSSFNIKKRKKEETQKQRA